MVKGIKLKEKSKNKKKGVRIQAIIGRIRTRDPDPGHLGPDFDSGSGLGSAFTDPGPGACLKARTFWTFLRTFYGLFGLDSHLKDMLGCVCVEGGELLPSKSGLKQEKLSGSATLLLDCAQVFYTSRGGGSEAPIRRMARWGLQVNRHGTSFIKINFNPRVCLRLLFSHSCTGRRT
jgi:hypothetical protein